MYHSPDGERILLGAERRLFETSLGVMVDHLSDDDFDFGVPVFDNLQRGQKVFALYRVGRALLRPDEPPPELNAYIEATVAAIYRHALDMVVDEIEDPPTGGNDPSWRLLVRDAFLQDGEREDVPVATSIDKEAWGFIIECLDGRVLWDHDFETHDRMDLDPELSHNVNRMMGISDNYYTDIAHDPPDDQLNLYLDALRGLTPCGRGQEFRLEENDSGGPLF